MTSWWWCETCGKVTDEFESTLTGPDVYVALERCPDCRDVEYWNKKLDETKGFNERQRILKIIYKLEKME